MALELFGLSQSFGGERVLCDVSLRVEPGRIVAFLGHNGAGKTTALRIALGLQRAEAGRVLVDGFDAAEHREEARARIGALIETPGFHGGMTARDNLVLLARLSGLDVARAAAESDRVLAVVGLGEFGARRVDAYSQGMRQRLGLAQALLGAPRYLLLDEPQNGLDPEGLVELRTLLVRLAREQGLGVLVSSHQLAELASFATDVVILRRGTVVHAGTMEELVELGRGTLRVEVRDAARARGVFERLGARVREDRGLWFELEAVDAERVARALLDAEAGLRELAPVATTLEEVYLRAQSEKSEPHRPAAAAVLSVSAPPGSAPKDRRAPRMAVWRVARYELARLSARGGLVWIGALPIVVALLALARRAYEGAADAEAVAGDKVFSVTRVTAFEGIGVALSAGLPLLAFAWCGLASQSVAGELARGTLRNMLFRPVERLHVLLGKAAAIAAAAVLTYLALAAAAVCGAAVWFDFDDVSELLPNGTRFVLTPAADLWPELARALSLPIPPLIAAALVGLACGTLVRGAAAAVGVALTTLVLGELARLVLRGNDIEAWLPGAHLPSPLADTSVVAYWLDFARGVSSAGHAFAETALAAPAAWIGLSLAVGCVMLSRRSVP